MGQNAISQHREMQKSSFASTFTHFTHPSAGPAASCKPTNQSVLNTVTDVQVTFSITASAVGQEPLHVPSWPRRPLEESLGSVCIGFIPGERSTKRDIIRHVWASSSLLTRLRSLSHLPLSGECSPHTSWTYMYQGFDIFAIFSCRRPLEVVIMMSHRLWK